MLKRWDHQTKGGIMENLYNTIFIVDISQNPDEAETVSSRIQQMIEDHGGIIKKINRWGKRRLTYSIHTKSHGFYVEIEYSANSRLNIPKILEGEFRLNDRVLRYMTYIVGKKELIQREKNAGKIRKREEETAEISAGKTASKVEIPVEAEKDKDISPMKEKMEIEPEKDQEEEQSAKILAEPEVKVEEQAETTPAEQKAEEETTEEMELEDKKEEKKPEEKTEKNVLPEDASPETAEEKPQEETPEKETE